MFLRSKSLVKVCFLSFSALLIPVIGIAGENPLRLASNGSMVPMPEISSLDCGSMAETIRRIDASGYRKPEAEGPQPGHPDHEIFKYENELTAREYFECTLGNSQYVDPALAFIKK